MIAASLEIHAGTASRPYCEQAESSPQSQIERLKHYCEQKLAEGFARMPVTAYNAEKHSSLKIEALQLRPEPWSLLAREDLGGVGTVSTVAIPLAGDCLAPWLHDGDVLFVELGRQCIDGDLITARVPDENSHGLFAFMTKLLHWYREDRFLLLSNEPPAWYSEEKQQRFQSIGVVVAAIHYATPAQRSPELQALIDASAEKGRREYGDDLWCADLLEYHLGHPIGS